ncbi:hypothetical protein [Peribacillus kribbensis]|uniref:hypothetical protein n=1 Tax=Peribacillus kribbensis TaxID=356658 RepID=UPI0003F770F6|nr:hypothetical protein [Peribacillus kribbensis]
MLLEFQLKKYPNGFIKTSKFGIYTTNAISIYILEVDLNFYQNLFKKDFAIINENSSYDFSDLE